MTAPDWDEDMKAAIAISNIGLDYSAHLRRFSIESPNPDPDNPMPEHSRWMNWSSTVNSGVIEELQYCPWSGRMLPGCLRDLWFEVLEKDYGLVSVYEDESTGNSNESVIGELDFRIPEEMVTDRWWRERNIGSTARPDETPDNWTPAEYRVHSREKYKLENWKFDRWPVGLWRSREAPPHLCEGLASLFSMARNLINYLPWDREYGISIIDRERPIPEQRVRIKPIRFCPRCGSELPVSLKAERLKRLAVLGTVPEPWDMPSDLPEEFRSDAWWKDANL